VRDFFNLRSLCQNTRRLTPDQRFDMQYIPEPTSGCWLWIGSVRNERLPYGRILVDGKSVQATKFAYERYIAPVSEGAYMCHKCDNSLCVNPHHLFPGTPADNSRDMVEKGRAVGRKGAKHHNVRLVETDILTIRASKDSYKSLATRYGISEKYVWKIKSHNVWKHLEASA